MFRELRACYGLLVLLLLLCGIAYPYACMGLGQALFPSAAGGSLVEDKGKKLGSRLVGQKFERVGYFHGRPSSAGNEGYDASQSGASNQSPSSQAWRKSVAGRIAQWRAAGILAPIPADLVTGSASGLDPDISPASAAFQTESIATARKITIHRINGLIESLTIPRDLGFLGEPRVNVLALNRALDDLAANDDAAAATTSSSSSSSSTSSPAPAQPDRPIPPSAPATGAP